VVVDATGRAVATLPAAASARDLTFDPVAKKLVIVGGGHVASAELPAGIVAAATQPAETRVPASVRPSPTAAPSPSIEPLASATPSASPSTSPGASAAPSASPEPSAVAAVPSASPSRPVGVPERATEVGPALYRLDLGGRVPALTAATVTRIWFVDTKNGLSSIDMATGALFSFTSFPRDAQITALAVGAASVYAVDGRFGRLFTFDVATERVSSRTLPFLQGNVSMTVAPDGRLWLGMEESAQILSFDPLTLRSEVVDTQMRGVVAIAIDNFARVWFADGQKTVGSYDLRNRRLTHVRTPGKGAARALLPDPSGSIWLGTTAGEVISVADDVPSIVAMTGRPITRLTLDPLGVAWYLTPAPQGTASYVYAPIRNADEARTITAPVTSLDFSLARAAWLADATGAFYIGVGASR
jgi:streptogramin lyase